MKYSKLKYKANRTKLNFKTMLLNKKQRNLVVKLNRNSKFRYFGDIEASEISEPFWNECKSYFFNKHAHSDSKIIFIEKEKIINNSNEAIKKETLLVSKDEIAETFKHFVETLNTFEWLSNNKD